MSLPLTDKTGLRHRADGPSSITNYDEDCKVWYIHGHDISDEVNEWMKKNDITYPWNEEIQMEFALRFVHVDRTKLISSFDIINRIRARTQNKG